MIVTQAIQNSLVQTLPGWGGVGITAFQVMATVTNFNAPVSSAPYSKFAHSIDSQSQTMVASKSGMTIIYLPALLASTCLYLANSFEMISVSPLASLLVILHFLKRVLEVQFLHKYSGTVGLGTSSMIGTYYALTAALICSIAEPVSPVVTAIGIGLFLLGSFGNFYHHCLLAKLRNNTSGNNKYVAPRGGLFEYTAAPHYLFELVAWLGIALVAQHLNAFLVFSSMSSYLGGRSIAQNEWNQEKFSLEDWPKSRKNMIPFLF